MVSSEAGRKAAREYYARNRELEQMRARKRYAANRAKQIEAHKLWSKNNPDKTRAHARLYYYRHRERCIEKGGEYRLLNKDKVRQQSLNYRSKNVEKVRQTKSATYKKARLKAFQKVAKFDTPKCVYCGCDDMRLLEINHKNGGGRQEELKPLYHSIVYAITTGHRSIADLEIVCRPHNAWHFLKLKYGDLANRFTIVWK